MSDIAIRVGGLSKQYRLGEREPYKSLRDVIVRAARAPLGWFSDNDQRSVGSEEDYFWALDDVAFEIKRGDAVGIIGRNGAGKSTLLKILSRITKPTRGYAEIYGRVGSLLEVGTGFHPELTGRENVYLNGAILGMRKHEIDRKFDEIIDFAGVEKYLDMPVKRYSSGMYVRLAFAVAAHLEPEILLVDEVLAVGDAEFQKKCLGKMSDVAGEGRTVLFVSHNMGAINALCKQAILLYEGQIVCFGPTTTVIDAYQQNYQVDDYSSSHNLNKIERKGKTKDRILRRVELWNDDKLTDEFFTGQEIIIKTYFHHTQPINGIRFGISIEDNFGNRIINLSPSHQCPDLITDPVARGEFICKISCLHLLEGKYNLTLILGDSLHDIDKVEQAIEFTVNKADVFSTGQLPGKQHGIYYENAIWEFK